MIVFNEDRPIDPAMESLNNMFEEQATPAHLYEGQKDLNIILEDMMKGAIPCNSKHPYKVIFKADIEAYKKQQQQQQQQMGIPFDPPYANR